MTAKFLMQVDQRDYFWVHVLFSLLWIVSFCRAPFAQTREIEIQKLSQEDGLANHTVYAICQDSRGFMWFGTENGLSRYDGYTFKNYFHDPDDSTSLSNNFVWSILEDHTETLWIGTVEGLNRYDRVRDCFVHFKHVPGNPASLSHSYVRPLLEDHTGTLWVGTINGLNRFDRDTETFTAYNLNPANPTAMDTSYMLALYEDRQHVLWIGTAEGYFRYDRAQDRLLRPRSKINDGTITGMRGVTSFYDDGRGNLWLTMWGSNGVSRINHDQKTEKYYQHELMTSAYCLFKDANQTVWFGAAIGLYSIDFEQDRFVKFKYGEGADFPRIYVIYQDRNGVLWLGTTGRGVYKVKQPDKKFNELAFGSHGGLAGSEYDITALQQDSEGEIWFGQNKTAYLMETEAERILPFKAYPNWVGDDPAIIEHLALDKNRNLWIGMIYNAGLHRLSADRRGVIHYYNDPKDEGSLASNYVTALYTDRNGEIWIGTEGEGMDRYDEQNNQFIHYKYDPDEPTSLSNNKIREIMEDHNGDFWVATWGGGFNKRIAVDNGYFDPNKLAFKRYQHDPKNPNSLNDNLVNSLCSTPDGNLWIGTENGGLNKLHVETGRFTHYTTKDGLASNRIWGILSDDRGRLWMVTGSGLAQFDPATETFRNYDLSDGLPTTEFYENAYLKSHSGELYFGGKGKTVVFHPDSIRDCSYQPPVVITKFQVFNRPFALDTAISEIKQIVLPHDRNMVAFEFAALDYKAPERIQYRYQLEGVDEAWIDTGSDRRFASYANLGPGAYVFRVVATNHDGVWNETGASIRLTILPPWWRTNFAYAGYVAVILGLLYGWRRFELHRARLKSELAMQRFEADKLREIASMKARFFANISHEFRTPLMLILGPMETLLSRQPNAETAQSLTMMQRNARRLQQLINQLLDLSKLDAGRMELKTTPENITKLLRGITYSFASLADSKNIVLDWQAPEEEIVGQVDAEKLEKILSNLLSNAFKFTPEGGVVSIEVAVGREQRVKSEGFRAVSLKRPQPSALSPEQLEITVRDTGIGISPGAVPHIFDRFYQVNDSATRDHEGTGIGLALTKELVELHGGTIRAESEPNRGTAFVVSLPFLPAEERDVQEKRQPAVAVGSNQFRPASATAPATATSAATRHGPVLLIVDDHEDVRTFIRNGLQQKYRVIEAANGEEGWKLAQARMPDLIISDVIMPVLNGFALCQRLKTDEKTCHIPVILLTAKAGEENKIEGLETGADAYLSKPFNTRELQARVRNLIVQRRALRERFRREMQVQPEEVTVTSRDAQFLQRATAIVEMQLREIEEGEQAKPDFSVAHLARRMNLSRQHLNRKMQGMLGMSANQFITTLRLKHAARLLEQRADTVTQVAYGVGFDNAGYFAACFRKQFGCSPSEFLGRQAKPSE